MASTHPVKRNGGDLARNPPSCLSSSFHVASYKAWLVCRKRCVSFFKALDPLNCACRLLRTLILEGSIIDFCSCCPLNPSCPSKATWLYHIVLCLFFVFSFTLSSYWCVPELFHRHVLWCRQLSVAKPDPADAQEPTACFNPEPSLLIAVHNSTVEGGSITRTPVSDHYQVSVTTQSFDIVIISEMMQLPRCSLLSKWPDNNLINWVID